jgi:hypothetical protein
MMTGSDDAWKANQAVYSAAHADGDRLTPALAQVVESGYWRSFEHPLQGLQEFETFETYCIEWIRFTAEAVLAILQASQFKSAARTVKAELLLGLEPLKTNGTNRHSDSSYGNTIAKDEGIDCNTADRVVQRLKRDNPQLAQQVINGTTTAHAAAIKAGHRKKRITMQPDDPHRMARAIRNGSTPETIQELIRLLSDNT